MAEEEYQIPIFLINGQLDSGKTRFISETIEMGQFDDAKKKLLIVCEEGEEEYDQQMLKDKEIDMVVLEKEEPDYQNLRLRYASPASSCCAHAQCPGTYGNVV